MQVDSVFLVLVTAGVLLAVVAAILVGTLTARLFFHMSRGEDMADRPHEVGR